MQPAGGEANDGVFGPRLFLAFALFEELPFDDAKPTHPFIEGNKPRVGGCFRLCHRLFIPEKFCLARSPPLPPWAISIAHRCDGAGGCVLLPCCFSQFWALQSNPPPPSPYLQYCKLDGWRWIIRRSAFAILVCVCCFYLPAAAPRRGMVKTEKKKVCWLAKTSPKGGKRPQRPPSFNRSNRQWGDQRKWSADWIRMVVSISHESLAIC